MNNRWQYIENPWVEQAKKWLNNVPARYVLSKEEAIVEAFNAKQSEESQLRLDVPPQPFQGTPDAKIWVLLQNSGYSTEGAEAGRHELCRQAMLKQLCFERNADGFYNYVLNEEFRNDPGRKWFQDRFLVNNSLKGIGLNDNRAIDGRFFLLQTFGYASQNADGGIPKGLRHMGYNKELLKWGVQNGKIIVIARAVDYWLKVVGEMWIDEHPEQFFVMSSSRSVYFSDNNLLLYHDWLQKEDGQNIAQAKQRANELMQKYLDK